jgi:AcrR family transcriptional regulator
MADTQAFKGQSGSPTPTRDQGKVHGGKSQAGMNLPQKKTASGNPSIGPDAHQRLEKAVMEVFSSVDFHEANMRTVAKKAGVSFSTIYKYYGSKEGLLFSFVDKRLKVLTDRMVDHLQGIENFKDKMRKVFWLQLDYYERNPELGRIIFMTVPLVTWMQDDTFVQHNLIRIFLDTLRQGQREGLLDPKVRAGVLLDVMYGLVQRSFFMWIYRGRRESLASQANELFEMCWRGMSNPERFVEKTN